MDINKSTAPESSKIDPEQIKPGEIWEISRRVRTPLDLSSGEQQNTNLLAHYSDGFGVSNQPLIGVVDTGFNSDRPDFDYNQITLRQDWVDGNDRPFWQAGESDRHGTRILGISAAKSDNEMGIDAIYHPALYPEAARSFLEGNSPPRYVMIVKEPEPAADPEEEWRIVSVMLLSVKTDCLSDADVLIPSKVSGLGQDLLAETWHVLPMLTCNLLHSIGRRLSRKTYDILLDLGDYYHGLINKPPTFKAIQSLVLKVGKVSAKQPKIQAFHRQEKEWAAVLQVPVAAYRAYLKSMKVTDAILEMAVELERELPKEEAEEAIATLEPSQTLVHLSQWFQKGVEKDWRTVEELLNASAVNSGWSFRGTSVNSGINSIDNAYVLLPVGYYVLLPVRYDAAVNAGNVSYNSLLEANPNLTDRQLITTDIKASGADYTDNFRGTSSADTLVSGLIALLLEANPNLTDRQIIELLNLTAKANPNLSDREIIELLSLTANKQNITTVSLEDSKEDRTVAEYSPHGTPHGTAVAGVAAASGSFGETGVAPDAYLANLRLLTTMEENQQEEPNETELAYPSLNVESGFFVVGKTGQFNMDFLCDRNTSYKGEIAIFSLESLDEFEPGSEEFIQEAARRALSASEFGHVVFSEQTERARFSSDLREINQNSEESQSVKTFSMRPYDRVGIMFVPNGTIQQVFDNPNPNSELRPLFSIAIANPNDAFHIGQIADITGDGRTFVMEDLQVDSSTDRDYNDLIFRVTGAVGKAVLLDEVIEPAQDWRDSELGQALISDATSIDIFNNSWNLSAFSENSPTTEDQGILDDEAVCGSTWKVTSEEGVVIGIVDDGLEYNPPNLQAKNQVEYNFEDNSTPELAENKTQLEEIAILIDQLHSAEDELQRRQAAKQLGEIPTQNADAIDALSNLISTTHDEETLWTAVESLWRLDPDRPASGIRKGKLIELGEQPDRYTVALTVTLIQKTDGHVGILLRLYPTGDNFYLPLDLKLILLDESGITLREVTARRTDAYIQLKLSGLPGEQFSVKVAIAHSSITENFLI